MISVGSVLWNASVTLIKNKDVHYVSQLSVRASRSNENNVCWEGSKWKSTLSKERGQDHIMEISFFRCFIIDGRILLLSCFLNVLKNHHFNRIAVKEMKPHFLSLWTRQKVILILMLFEIFMGKTIR